VRKLIVANIMSLDGYFEGPEKNVMALPMDGFFDEHNLERLRAADTLLLGATTYMGLKGYWPAVAEDPMASPAVAADPEVADLHRETGLRNNQIRKVVVSDSITEKDTAPWTETTTIVRRNDAHRAVAELKEQPGEDILTFGSQNALERPALRRPGGRAPPDGRRERARRRDAGVPDRHGRVATADGHATSRWLGQRAAALRGDP
jgi:dihydrofolate reductase